MSYPKIPRQILKKRQDGIVLQTIVFVHTEYGLALVVQNEKSIALGADSYISVFQPLGFVDLCIFWNG